ncbi:MAG TPA: FliH/SctL family protein [Fimbriimonadaceae bacterium]|nr:FliH/SctL family protein [Fimbriimonadaceae bacterium]
MSKDSIFRPGTVKTEPFVTKLGELPEAAVPRKKRAAHEAAVARQRALDEAREEARALGQNEGFEIGHKAGYQAGFDQAYAEASNKQSEMLRAFAADLQTVRDRLEEAIREWFEAAEVEAEDIAVEIAQKLLHAQLSLDRSYIIEAAKAALSQLTEASHARIRVNPFDSVILSNAREELLAATASLRGVEVVDDSSILGGCIVETDRGAVDATVSTRFEVLQGGLEVA